MRRLMLLGLLISFASPMRADTSTLTFHSVHLAKGWMMTATEKGRRVLHTNNGGRTWKDVTPAAIRAFTFDQGQEHQKNGEYDFQIACLHTSTAWIVEKPLDNIILVERTSDGGRHWQTSRFTDTIGYSLVATREDAKHGSILSISDMASGSTKKALYRTKDSGRTWTFVTKTLPDHIDPTGVISKNGSTGWLTAGYHGSDEMPFYQTHDGGHHWHLQELDTSALGQEGYGITYPPTFFGPKHCLGILPMHFRSNKAENSGIALYQTQNAGRTWRLLRLLPRRDKVGLTNLHFINFNTGWAFDSSSRTPKLMQTRDGGRHWQTIYPARRRPH